MKHTSELCKRGVRAACEWVWRQGAINSIATRTLHARSMCVALSGPESGPAQMTSAHTLRLHQSKNKTKEWLTKAIRRRARGGSIACVGSTRAVRDVAQGV